MFCEYVGRKPLLAQSPRLAKDPQVAAERSLQLAFHAWKAAGMLLYSLQTDKYHLEQREGLPGRQTLPVVGLGSARPPGPLPGAVVRKPWSAEPRRTV
jgi:hypothetical protein